LSVRSSPDPPIFKKIAVRSSPDPAKFGFSPRDEHGSGMDRTGSGLKPIFAGQDWIGLDQDWSQFLPDRTGSDCIFFSKLADQDWIGLRKFLLF